MQLDWLNGTIAKLWPFVDEVLLCISYFHDKQSGPIPWALLIFIEFVYRKNNVSILCMCGNMV